MYDIYQNDDLDTRRELYADLGKLTLPNRLAFIKHCADNLNSKTRGWVDAGTVQHKVRDTTSGDLMETYHDVGMLLMHGLKLDDTMRTLRQFVKRQERNRC